MHIRPLRDHKMYVVGVIYVMGSLVIIAGINYVTWKEDPTDYTVLTYMF